jgi:hypothetical protein
MDYRNLLKKYLDHVADMEGTDFLGTHWDPPSKVYNPTFTEEEWSELIKISRNETVVQNETGTCYLIECRTGCTCCADENHYRGPFSTREIAQKAVEAYEQIPLLASQFAARGRYTIEEAGFEKLPDGRMIINGDRIWTEGFQDECLGLTERYE